MKNVTFTKDYDLRVYGECGSGGCRTWKSFKSGHTYLLPTEQAEMAVTAGVATWAKMPAEVEGALNVLGITDESIRQWLTRGEVVH